MAWPGEAHRTASSVTRQPRRLLKHSAYPRSVTVGLRYVGESTKVLNRAARVIERGGLFFSLLAHHRKILRPWTDVALVSLRHHATDLEDVRQIVSRPGGNQLPHGDNAHARMHALPFKIRSL